MEIARLAARRPVAVTVLAVAVVILGWISWRELPLDLFPDLQSPTILVSIRSGDRPPTEMERLYGEQVEQRLFAVRGIKEITQVARTGRLISRVTFEWDADMDLALVDVQKAVNPIGGDPDVEEVLVRRFDPRQLPVVVLGLVAPEGRPDLAELRRVARRQVAPALEQLDGVAEVRVTGGREKEVQVLLDRYLMEAHGVTISLLTSRLRALNIDISAGTLEEGDSVYLVRGLSRFHSAADVAAAVIRYGEDDTGRRVPIRVADLGDVVLADQDISDLVRVDGIEGVGLSVYKEAGANTVAVSHAIGQAMQRLSADLPQVEARVVSDEASLVRAAIAEVEDAALIGIALAVLVLVLFLRSPGPTLIVAVSVPVSLLATVFAMHLWGHSLNLMTLGGLALGAGMLVDNAIVVVESVFRRRLDGDDIEDAAAHGTSAVASAIAAATLTTCVVFLPVLFVRGLTARLINGLAFAVVVSLVASLLVAVLLIPALTRWLLPKRRITAVDPGAARIESLVLRLLRRPLLVVALTTVLCGLAVAALLDLGTELLPPADPHQFSLRLTGPPGQRVESTSVTTAAIEEIISSASGDDLRATLAEVGRLPDDYHLIREEQTEENTARVMVRLASDGRTASTVVSAAAPAAETLANVEVDWEVGASALSRALGTSGPPLQVELAGRSLPDLRRGANNIVQQLENVPQVWNVRSSFEGGPPELRVVLDRTLADGLGVDLDTVAGVLEAALDGRRVGVITVGDEERNIVLRLPGVRREELLSLPFTSPSGVLLSIGDVARFEPREGAREIYRRDQRRVALVSGRISDGVTYPEALAAVRMALAEVDLAPGLTLRLSGEEEERQTTFRELSWAGALALLLVFMVLAGTFESLLHPFTVAAAVPVALVGVAAVLVPIGHPIGVMSVLGLIVLLGVAVNDAILLVQTARDLIKQGAERTQALARAAALRLRPILMTTATTVLALLPLAIGGGEAAELRSPLALTIIGGIIASTVGSLLVTPCLYLLLDRLEHAVHRSSS